jgi:hypothetical protein
MCNLPSFRKFEYRRTRTKAGFSVDFIAEGETFHGLCKDVSDSGICAEFDGPIVAGSSGLLILRHTSGVLKLEARVSHTDNGQVGLIFLFKTPAECDITVGFIASITDRTDFSSQR